MTNEGIGTWIHRRRVKSAGKAALIIDDTVIRYEELAGRIDKLANVLTASDIRPGDRVAYLGPNQPEFLETLFAVTTLGAVFVPLNTRLTPAEIRYALQDSGAKILIYASELADNATSGAAETDVTKLFVVPGSPPDQGETDSREAGSSLAVAVDQASAGHPEIEVALTDPAIILYTSGTTGNPKGAVLAHQNVIWNCYNVLVDYDVTSNDVALAISPMFHVASLNMGVLPALLKGASVILERRFDPASVLALIEKYRVTNISGVPTTYQLLVEHPRWPNTDLTSLRTLNCGGSPVPLRVLDAYEQRGLSFTGGYGMTETAPGTTSLQPMYSRTRAGSAGLPHFFTEVRIAGEDGSPEPSGTVGEIQVRGPNVIKEYWQQPDASASAFVEGGWFRSGDLGYFDDDGFLYISGRLKDMIISGGENIYPVEIEQVILELDAVASVAVVAAPDDKWGEVPHAYIELRDGYTLEDGEIQQHLAGRVARFKIPKIVTILSELPRTASGKIIKGALKAQ